MQTFKDLIDGGYLYADKTKYVYDLARSGKAYFLSRPRRFGKSLLISTFEALFSGPSNIDAPPQGLFADLWIGRESDYDFNQIHPVIILNMDLDSPTPEDLRNDLKDMLQAIARTHGLEISGSSPGRMLANLITGLHEKHDAGVVLLIDEYDSPVSDNIDDLALAQANRAILKNFYSKLKSCDKSPRFVFVTGVTRYAFMGLSAGLNHLADLTLREDFAGICGFTLDEFDDCFKEHLPVILEKMKKNGSMGEEASLNDLQDKILRHYDGYSWDGETMILNPISILNMFGESYFSNYWIQTNPSVSFLSKVANENPLALLGDESEKISQGTLGLAEVGGLGPVPALFQTGYLTIDQVAFDSERNRVFTLKIPNLEVRNNNFPLFLDSFYKFLGRKPETERDMFHGAIRDRDAGKLTRIINSLFAGLPAEHHADNESCYHKVLYGYCHKFGRIVTPERKGAIGNSDLLVIFPDGLYAVMELKFDVGKSIPLQTRLVAGLAQTALSAIDEKDYWRPFQAEAKDLVKIGLGVSWRGQCLALMGSGE
jgi:hypothetical protein